MSSYLWPKKAQIPMYFVLFSCQFQIYGRTRFFTQTITEVGWWWSLFSSLTSLFLTNHVSFGWATGHHKILKSQWCLLHYLAVLNYTAYIKVNIIALHISTYSDVLVCDWLATSSECTLPLAQRHWGRFQHARGPGEDMWWTSSMC